MMIKDTSYEVHIPKTLLRWLGILTFTRRSLDHSSIKHRCLPEVVHVLLVIDLSVMIGLSKIAIICLRIFIHTIEVILRVSKLARIIDEAIAAGTAWEEYNEQLSRQIQIARISNSTTIVYSLTHLFVLDLFDDIFFVIRILRLVIGFGIKKFAAIFLLYFLSHFVHILEFTSTLFFGLVCMISSWSHSSTLP